LRSIHRFALVMDSCFPSFSSPVKPRLSILTNLSFHQSPRWEEAVTTICKQDESPDELNPIRQAFRLLKLRPRFDVVVTMGPRPSLAYGILCGLLFLPSKQIMTEVFLDEARPASLSWRIKTALFRWVARRSIGILTNSSAEVEFIATRFNIPRKKLRFVPMHTTITPPEHCTQNEGFVLSVGRTFRDLETLFQAASHFEAPLVLIVGKEDLLPASLPPKVEVLRELPLEAVHEKMKRAALVVIPLFPAERSTGQVVLFEAMALGKPVVATRVTGTVDYIRDGENGLLVEPQNADALAKAVRHVLQNPDLVSHLTRSALEDCTHRLHPDRHAQKKLMAIEDLWRGTPPA